MSDEQLPNNLTELTELALELAANGQAEQARRILDVASRMHPEPGEVISEGRPRDLLARPLRQIFWTFCGMAGVLASARRPLTVQSPHEGAEIY